MSARTVVREAAGFDPVALGRGVRLDVEWMDGVLTSFGEPACDLCGNPRAKVVSVTHHAYEREGGPSVVEVPLCDTDAAALHGQSR